LNIENPAAGKPASFLNAVQLKKWSLIGGVHLVMRRPF